MNLIDAIKKNKVDLVKEFLNKGVDPNEVEDLEKITPLHFAVAYKRFDIIPLLIKSGADKKAKSSDGQTPLDLAKSLFDDRVLKKIEDSMR